MRDSASIGRARRALFGRRPSGEGRAHAASDGGESKGLRFLGHAARLVTACADRRLVGSAIGDYRLARLLGQGRYGSCFEAERIAFQGDSLAVPAPCRVAMKLVKPRKGRIDRQAVWAECGALSLLDRAGVPRWLGIEQAVVRGEEPRYFIVETLCGGDCLSRLLKSGYVFSDGDIARIGSGLIDLVLHAASRGVVHGDIRPANVLVDAGGSVSLVDFGLARFYDRTRDGRECLAASSPDIEGVAETILFMLYSDARRLRDDARRHGTWRDELHLDEEREAFLADAFFAPEAFGTMEGFRGRFEDAFGFARPIRQA